MRVTVFWRVARARLSEALLETLSKSVQNFSLQHLPPCAPRAVAGMFRALSPLRAASAVGAARRYLSVHEYLSSAFPAPALRLAGGWRRAPSAAALRRHRHRPPRPRSGAARRARCGRAAGRRGDDAGGRGGGGRQHPVGLGDGRRGGRRRHQGAGADGRPRPGHLYQRLPRRRAHGDVGGASREHCAQNARPAADYEAGALRRRAAKSARARAPRFLAAPALARAHPLAAAAVPLRRLARPAAPWTRCA